LQAQITRIVDTMAFLEQERRAHLGSIASKGSRPPARIVVLRPDENPPLLCYRTD
jgi:hypothetical protein